MRRGSEGEQMSREEMLLSLANVLELIQLV